MQPDNLQRTDEWFKARLGRATASRFSDIMATIKSGESAARKNYRAELVAERLTGQQQNGYQSSAMAWGVDNEPIARMFYELASGNTVVECGFFEHPTLMAGASPDGLIDDTGLLEIKCPNIATHLDTLHSLKVPNGYYSQVQGQLWITGRKWADFVSFDPRLPENARLVIIPVKRDEEYIQRLETEVIDFLNTVDEEVDFIKSYGKITEEKGVKTTNRTAKSVPSTSYA